MSTYIIYKNTKIHYSVIGNGPAVVLLHGFLENIAMWNDLSEKISKTNKVVCIDLLGHGLSENLGYVHTMKEQAEMVKFVLNYLKLRRYFIVGHSMGGYIGLSFAKHYAKNLKGLCLMNSTALADTDEKKINRNRAIKAVKQNHKTFVRIAIPMLFSEKNRTVFTDAIKKITIEALKTSPQGIIAALEGMKNREDNTAILHENLFPIQMIIGKQDPALDYNSSIKQTIGTNVEVTKFPDGHMSHIENKNELIKAIQGFIKKN
jgi:pimeloyl-ACP methyl ester carboxylesterase